MREKEHFKIKQEILYINPQPMKNGMC